MKNLLFKNTTIAFTDVGKGTVVVLLHGFLENKYMWEELITEFSKRNRVITLDLLGHGDSECLGYQHTMEDNAAVVHAVLSHLRIRKAIFIGHSMGGYVALAFAELYPQMVKGIVLLHSTSRADTEERKVNRDRAIKVVKKNYVGFVSLSIANLFSEDNRERLFLEIENVKKEALKTPLQGIVASLEGMKIRKDREFILQTAHFPILLILGKKDTVLPYETTVNQIENTNVQLVSLPDGHMSHLEKKEAVALSLLLFIKNTTAFWSNNN